MERNFWIVVGVLVGVALIVIILNKLSGLKLVGGGLIKPETGVTEVPVSDEVKNRSAVDVVLNPKPFPVSFEKADAVSEKVAKIFGGEDGQEWFAGTWAPEDEKYGHVVELRMYSEALKLTPGQLQYFPDSKDVDGVQIRLSIIEGGVPVPFKKKIDK